VLTPFCSLPLLSPFLSLLLNLHRPLLMFFCVLVRICGSVVLAMFLQTPELCFSLRCMGPLSFWICYFLLSAFMVSTFFRRLLGKYLPRLPPPFVSLLFSGLRGRVTAVFANFDLFGGISRTHQAVGAIHLTALFPAPFFSCPSYCAKRSFALSLGLFTTPCWT